MDTIQAAKTAQKAARMKKKVGSLGESLTGSTTSMSDKKRKSSSDGEKKRKSSSEAKTRASFGDSSKAKSVSSQGSEVHA
jgi:hypothetical protein